MWAVDVLFGVFPFVGSARRVEAQRSEAQATRPSRLVTPLGGTMQIGLSARARLPFLPQMAVKASVEMHDATSHHDDVHSPRIVEPKPLDTADNPLSHLTDADRELVRATTGEVIAVADQLRPISAFAMQIAVDRARGALPASMPVTRAYLTATARRFDEWDIPGHPFSGETLKRALEFVGPDHRVDLRV